MGCRNFRAPCHNVELSLTYCRCLDLFRKIAPLAAAVYPVRPRLEGGGATPGETPRVIGTVIAGMTPGDVVPARVMKAPRPRVMALLSLVRVL